jgi:type I restriction enzyme S subunit
LKGLEISIISYQKAIGGDATGRIDSSFFEKRFIELRKMAAKWDRLDSHARSIVCGPFGSNLLNDNYVEKGIPMVRPFNLRNGRIDAGEVALVEEAFIEQAGLKTFGRGTLMFARVGDIGAGISLGEKVTISPNIIAAELNETIDPHFVGVFANTRFGQLQLEAGMKVVAQPTISTDAIRALRIPQLSQLFQQRIAALFHLSVGVQETGKRLLVDAETILLQALDLENWKAPGPLSYVRSSRDAFDAGRLDAEHFHEGHYALRKKLSSYPAGYAKLCDLSQKFTNGAEIRNYQDEGTPYLRVGDLKNLSIDDGSVVFVDPIAAADVIDKVRLETGDVLVSRSGSLAVSAVVEREWESALISSHLIRLRIADPSFDPYFVALFLRTLPGRMQIMQWSNGGVQPEISQPSLGKLIVPKVTAKVQLDIRRFILEAANARKRSADLLNAAKRAVEVAIEQDEKAAFIYLEANT